MAVSDAKINTSFSKQNPKLQWAWDSTSLGALKTCPRYYQYNIIEGYQSKGENIHFIFGIGVHSALELYDRLRAEGKEHDHALRETLRFILTYTWNQDRNRPWISDDPNKNRATLIRAVIWYLLQFEDDVLETVILDNGKPAVELSFSFETGIHAPTGEEYLLCGHLDRLVMWNERYWIVDRKTTKYTLTANQSFFHKFAPDNQMSLYYLAGSFIFLKPIRGIIIDAVQTAATFTRFQRGFTHRTKGQLDEWFEDFEFYLRQAEAYAQANYWPMNDKSCNNYGGCPYRVVCSASPEQRPELLNGLFIKRIWDPLITREP